MCQATFPSLLSVVFAAWKDPVPVLKFWLLSLDTASSEMCQLGTDCGQWGSRTKTMNTHRDTNERLENGSSDWGIVKGVLGEPRAGRKGSSFSLGQH